MTEQNSTEQPYSSLVNYLIIAVGGIGGVGMAASMDYSFGGIVIGLAILFSAMARTKWDDGNSEDE